MFTPQFLVTVSPMLVQQPFDASEYLCAEMRCTAIALKNQVSCTSTRTCPLLAPIDANQYLATSSLSDDAFMHAGFIGEAEARLVGSLSDLDGCLDHPGNRI